MDFVLKEFHLWELPITLSPPPKHFHLKTNTLQVYLQVHFITFLLVLFSYLHQALFTFCAI